MIYKHAICSLQGFYIHGIVRVLGHRKGEYSLQTTFDRHKMFSSEETEKVKKLNEKKNRVPSRVAATVTPTELNKLLWIFFPNKGYKIKKT